LGLALPPALQQLLASRPLPRRQPR